MKFNSFLVSALILCLLYIPIVILSVFIHELGHLVCGLMSGYKFSSFNIMSFVVTRDNGKLKLGRLKRKGVAGQCLMVPPKDFKDFKFVLYNLGGGLFNIITFFVALLIFILICLLVKSVPVWGFSIFMFALYNLLLGVLNLVPSQSFLPNDGRNIKTAKESVDASYGLYLMLLVNSYMVNGHRLRDFDQSFVVNPLADKTNYLVAYTHALEFSRLCDLGRFDDAANTYNGFDLDNMQKYYSATMKCDLLYYYLVHNQDFQKAYLLYSDKNVKQVLSFQLPTFFRIKAACEFFLNNNPPQAAASLGAAKAALAGYPNQAVAVMEIESINDLETLFLKNSTIKQQ